MVTHILPEMKTFKAVFVVYRKGMGLFTRCYCQLMVDDVKYIGSSRGLHLAQNSIWQPTQVYVMSPNISYEKRARISKMVVRHFESDIFTPASKRMTNIITDKVFDSSSSEINACRREVGKIGFDPSSLATFEVIRYAHIKQMLLKSLLTITILGSAILSLEIVFKRRQKKRNMMFIMRCNDNLTNQQKVVPIEYVKVMRIIK